MKGDLLSELQRRLDVAESAAARNYSQGSNRAALVFDIKANAYAEVIALLQENK